MITEQLIRRQSGEYDCEVVTRVKIEGFGIRTIANLENCINLVDLSLAKNEISTISGLECLTLLKRLDLSHNKIRRIENLGRMASLEWLDLRGNSISNIDDVAELQTVPTLRSLFLRNDNGDEANPACGHPAYMSIVMRNLPQLMILDGGLVGLTEATNRVEEELAAIQPDPMYLEPLPPQPWFDAAALAPFNEEASAGREVVEVIEKVQDIIREESAHIYRKSQTALNKAQSMS